MMSMSPEINSCTPTQPNNKDSLNNSSNSDDITLKLQLKAFKNSTYLTCFHVSKH